MFGEIDCKRFIDENYNFIMLSEPVLDIYSITISRRKKEEKSKSCFYDLFKESFNNLGTEVELFKKFSNKFLSELEKETCYNVRGSANKVLTIKPTDIEGDRIELDPNINICVQSHRFACVLHGGAYNSGIHTTPVENRKEMQLVDTSTALTNEFFVYIVCPPKSNKGILMIQSYSGNYYRDHVTTYLTDKILFAENYMKVQFMPVFLDSLKSRIKSHSVTQSITYDNGEKIDDTVGDDDVSKIFKNFDISVNIKARGDSRLGSKLENLQDALAAIIPSKTISFLQRKKVVVCDTETNKQHSYFLDNADSMKPKIQLRNVISVDDNNKFSYSDLLGYCDEIKSEVLDILRRR